jgi:hypothetical protein
MYPWDFLLDRPNLHLQVVVFESVGEPGGEVKGEPPCRRLYEPEPEPDDTKPPVEQDPEPPRRWPEVVMDTLKKHKKHIFGLLGLGGLCCIPTVLKLIRAMWR